jgi:hypothetical protein
MYILNLEYRHQKQGGRPTRSDHTLMDVVVQWQITWVEVWHFTGCGGAPRLERSGLHQNCLKAEAVFAVTDTSVSRIVFVIFQMLVQNHTVFSEADK